MATQRISFFVDVCAAIRKVLEIDGEHSSDQFNVRYEQDRLEQRIDSDKPMAIAGGLMMQFGKTIRVGFALFERVRYVSEGKRRIQLRYSPTLPVGVDPLLIEVKGQGYEKDY